MVAGCVSLALIYSHLLSFTLIVALCSIVFLLHTTKRRLRFDSSKQTKEREKAHDSQSEQQAWLRLLIEQLENQYRRHNIDMFKDGNFDTYSFDKEDIAKVFLIGATINSYVIF